MIDVVNNSSVGSDGLARGSSRDEGLGRDGGLGRGNFLEMSWFEAVSMVDELLWIVAMRFLLGAACFVGGEQAVGSLCYRFGRGDVADESDQMFLGIVRQVMINGLGSRVDNVTAGDSRRWIDIVADAPLLPGVRSGTGQIACTKPVAMHADAFKDVNGEVMSYCEVCT